MKVAIVVLVLVAILFGVAVGLGFRKEKPHSEQRDDAEKGNPPSWTKLFGGKDGKSLMPGIKLKKDRLDVPGPDGVAVIEPSTEPFRLLKLAYVSGSEITVEFHSMEPPPKTMDKMDDPQTFTLIPEGHDDHDHHRFFRSSVVVFKSGGTLKLTVSGGPPGTIRKGVVKVE